MNAKDADIRSQELLGIRKEVLRSETIHSFYGSDQQSDSRPQDGVGSNGLLGGEPH